MNPTLLSCQQYLHPDEPVQLTSKDLKPHFEKLGWKEGDLIPGGLPEYTKAVLKVLKLPVNTKNALKIFDQEEVQVTLTSALNNIKLLVNEQEAVAEEVKKLVPNADNLNSAVKGPVMALAESEARKKLKQKVKKIEIPEVEDEFEDIAEDVPEPEIKPEVPVIATPICPRCGLDLREPYVPVVVTEEDRNSFLYSILGGTPFTKRYLLFHDTLAVTFKSLTAEEINLINEQVRQDIYSSKSISLAQKNALLHQYTMALHLADIEILKEGFPQIAIISWKSKQFNSETDTNLRRYKEYIDQTIYSTEIRYTLITQAFEKFQKLYIQLHDETENENFWNLHSDND